MPLLNFWKTNRDEVLKLSIEQVLSNAGDGVFYSCNSHPVNTQRYHQSIVILTKREGAQRLESSPDFQKSIIVETHMHRRQLFFLTCLLCFAASAVLAQDILKVAGGAETHKVVLDNDQIRMLDAHVPPGQKIAMHSHPPNTVYYMTDCKLKVTSPDGKTTLAEPKAGTAVYRGETTHAVENVGGECHLVQTELKEKK